MSRLEDEMTMKLLKFSINGKTYTVGPNVPPSTTLLQYLREFAELPGSKACCYEGGCGVCTVVATIHDLETSSEKSFSLRSCQTLVYSCAGWAIETIEHLGNRYKGYHILQKALMGFYGTQCGYCSPGIVMNMYGELKDRGELTVARVEKSLDGNLCRCTGYRPILDAFKSLAVDAPKDLKDKMIDIEDCYKSLCPISQELCKGQCSKDEMHETSCHNVSTAIDIKPLALPDTEIDLTVGDIRWFRPVSISGVYKIIQNTNSEKVIRFVVGNTGEGVYKNDGPFDVYIDTTGIADLYTVGIGDPLILGANVSLSRCISAFEKAAKENIGFKHLQEIANHFELVANVGVRNTGSWAGNLMLKHAHREFPSDIFLLLMVADARILIGNSANSSTIEVTVEEFMKLDMSSRLILSITIPTQDQSTIIKTYKISPRAVNAHCYVDAAFKFKVNLKDGFKILAKPTLLFGGIHPEFVHADATEKFLVDKRLDSGAVVTKAIDILGEELQPDCNPQDASPQYRKSVAQSLFYKAVLNILQDAIIPEFRSGGFILERPISGGQQHFDENKGDWPIGKPIPKLESMIQVSGEAEYVDDMPSLQNELHGAFVQSTVAKASIKSIDPSKALKIPGVVAFIRDTDVPGINSFVQNAGRYHDPIFSSSKTSYYGQSVGLIVAERRDIAIKAVKYVQVEYSDIEKPILTIKEALEKKSSCEPEEFDNENFSSSAHIIEGELEQGSQFHMSMEPLVARVIPVEDGYDVFCATQWPSETQLTMAKTLNISCNSINMTVKRLGGAFGCKISRTNLLSCAAAVAANKLQRPVRINLDVTSHMTLVGWRERFLSKYKVGFNDDGLLENVAVQFISDGGSPVNNTSSKSNAPFIPNVYKSKRWSLLPVDVETNTASNTYARAPGSTQAIATMENIIEHIAASLDKDPTSIRELNFIDKKTDSNPNNYGPKGENMIRTEIFPLLKKQSMYERRRAEVDQFNKENRWNKKGLSMIPLYYNLSYPPPFRYDTQVCIYAADGTVVISHGGIEMGQGINTKAAQVAAKILKVSLELIKIKPTNLVVGANSFSTAGSFGSELVAYGVQKCCETLRQRLDEIETRFKKTFQKDPTWPEMCAKASDWDYDLSYRYWTANKEHPMGYDIFGCICMEVEIDVLTGQYLINRTDVIEDCGRSLSPFVDIGQVEGSLIMGFGFYTSEIVVYDPKSGEKLSNNTWNYKVPTALDIPTDLRISFLSKGDNKAGVVRSKSTGEPGVCMSYCIVTALRNAIGSARTDAGIAERWFDMPTPLTVERIQQLCKVDSATQILLMTD